MSSGAGCTVFEKNPGEWYYDLQRYPYGETDEYNRYGPFGSEAAVDDHIRANHSNPGGWWLLRYNPDKPYRPSYTVHERKATPRRRRW